VLRPDFPKPAADESLATQAADRLAEFSWSSRRLEALAVRCHHDFKLDQHQQIIKAIEAGSVGELQGSRLHAPADRIRSELLYRDLLGQLPIR